MELLRKVVLIDDDPDDYEIFSMALAQAAPGAECVYYESAEAAYKQLKLGNAALPDYIFLDMNMPRMNGIQFLELLKKDDNLAPVPVIIYSTSILPSTKQKAEEYGAYGFFAKPTSQVELVKILENLLAA